LMPSAGQAPMMGSPAEAALALYPQDPQGLAWLAKTEFAAGRELASVEFMQAAMGHFKEALAMDQRRLAWETIRRLRPREVEEIHRKIEDIQRYLSERQQP